MITFAGCVCEEQAWFALRAHKRWGDEVTSARLGNDIPRSRRQRLTRDGA